MNTRTVSKITFVITLVFFLGLIVFSFPQASTDEEAQNNVSVVDGKQIIEIVAKGGYSPRKSSAKANMPTVIKVKTKGTFDCSSALTIPSIGYQKYLPLSGETLIEIPAQQKDSTLLGLCSMGMYNFAIKFS